MMKGETVALFQKVFVFLHIMQNESSKMNENFCGKTINENTWMMDWTKFSMSKFDTLMYVKRVISFICSTLNQTKGSIFSLSRSIMMNLFSFFTSQRFMSWSVKKCFPTFTLVSRNVETLYLFNPFLKISKPNMPLFVKLIAASKDDVNAVNNKINGMNLPK